MDLSFEKSRIEFSEHLRKYSSVETQRTYDYVILSFETWLEEEQRNKDELTRDDIQDYLNYRDEAGIVAATISKEFNAIKKFCRFIKKPELIDGVRIAKAASIKRRAPKSLRDIERESVIEEMANNDTVRNLAILHMLLNTGVRVSELTGINRDDIFISSNAGEVRIRHGKGNKERYLPLNKEARDILSLYLSTRKDKHECLFLGQRGRLGKRGVQYVLERYNIHPHRLRHTFITDLVRSDTDLVIVQSLSGHASMDMLSRYSQPTQEDLQQTVEGMYRKR